METWRRYITIVVIFVETTVLAGALLGWPSLVFIYQAEGLYHYLCDNEYSNSSRNVAIETRGEIIQSNKTSNIHESADVQCLAQRLALTKGFTVGMGVFGLCAMPVGYFFDKFGLRPIRTVLGIVGILSYVQLALASPGSEWLVITGATGVGLSAYMVIMTNCHVAHLSKTKPSTIIGILMAGMDTSFAYTAVKIGFDHGFPRTYGLIIVGAFFFLVLFSTWCLLPPFKVTDEQTYEDVAKSESQLQENTVEHTLSDKNKNKSAKDILLSCTFLLFLLWFSSINLRINMMTNEYNAFAASILQGSLAKVSYFTNVLAYCNFLEVVPCCLIGVFMDWMVSKIGTRPGGKELAMTPAVTTASLLAIIMSSVMFIYRRSAIYVIILFFDFTKPVAYTTANSFGSIVYPPEVFGKVYGATYTVEGITVFLMIPLTTWIESSGFTPVNAFILGTLVLGLALPLKLCYDWGVSQRREPEKAPLIENGLKK